MIKYISLIVLLIISGPSMSKEALDCDDVNVGSMGLAWFKDSCVFFTGTLICISKNKEVRTPYIDGYKQGKEVSTWVDEDSLEITEEKIYEKGIATKGCIMMEFSNFTDTECRNIDCAAELCR
jgi:hypothetical protein